MDEPFGAATLQSAKFEDKGWKPSLLARADAYAEGEAVDFLPGHGYCMLAMNAFLLISGILASTLAFAFLMAAAAPLMVAAQEARDARAGSGQGRGLLQILDMLMWLVASLQVVSIIAGMANAPEDVRVARKKWQDEPMLRRLFYASCVSAVLALLCFRVFW